jgi:hypothetical protein
MTSSETSPLPLEFTFFVVFLYFLFLVGGEVFKPGLVSLTLRPARRMSSSNSAGLGCGCVGC